VYNGVTAYITQLKQQKSKKGAITFAARRHNAWAYLEGGRGGRGPPPPIEEIFASFKYSLSSFLPNHVYNLCRIAW